MSVFPPVIIHLCLVTGFLVCFLCLVRYLSAKMWPSIWAFILQLRRFWVYTPGCSRGRIWYVPGLTKERLLWAQMVR
ncbi:hypothetical protein AB205_0108760 [Aquarana catesbeiana]|uniref:Uncharacterized protein n=1 Tax=Aquarana catesbeiana TaxID=8400 RepID=A0A2G9R508_AQUCT|nr:hypothetical protein AB205_0108760 [Aquarana catesbeiana]